MNPNGDTKNHPRDLAVGIGIGAAPIVLAFLPEGGPFAIVLLLLAFGVGMYFMERSQVRRGLGKGMMLGAGGVLIVGVLGLMALGLALSG